MAYYRLTNGACGERHGDLGTLRMMGRMSARVRAVCGLTAQWDHGGY